MPPSCSCREHQKISEGKESYVHKISNKKIKADVLTYMKNENLLPRNSNAVCQLCVDYVSRILMNTSSSKRKHSEINDIVDGILNKFDYNEVAEIAEAIGNRITDDIDKDVISISGAYKDQSMLTSFCVSAWLKNRNNILVRFLMASTGCQNDNSKKEACIANAVDSIYKARRLTHVAPMPFCNNLIAYYVSGSKVITKINNRYQACGSYTTLLNWLRSKATQPLQNNSIKDQVTFFDNNQVIARNWRVSYGYRSSASVITMLLHITPSVATTLQQSAGLSPRQWLHDPDSRATSKHIQDAVAEGEQSYAQIRNNYIRSRLVEVINEKRRVQNGMSDPIQDEIDGIFGPKRKPESADPYAWVPNGHMREPPEVKVGEPALYNPCSYASVKTVLQHISDKCGVGARRKWTCVGCDGLPYTLGSRIIDSTDELKDILLIPGLGHIEINVVKSCFKLLWDVCLEDVAKMLGFRSPRALVCCKACTDHHKSWMILSIFFNATIDELLTTYIKHDQSPSVNGLYRYISQSTDKNFRFMCDIVFNYVLAVFVFRCGVRRNNSHYITASKSQFLKLFFGLNQTNYQEIMYRDFKTQVLAPREVKSFLEQTESFSVSGHQSKGEGGDFVLEAVNRRAKRWLPPGIPKQSHWIEVCRNLDLLEEIRNTFQDTRASGSDSIYQRDLSTEILQWRVRIRQSCYLDNTRNATSPHLSMSGAALDNELVKFEQRCKENTTQYITAIGNGATPGKRVNLTPVFITPLHRSDYHDLEKKPKAQLVLIIENSIAEIRQNGHIDEALVLDSQWTKIKVKTKKDMLMFYKEVKAALENATGVESDNDDSDDNDDGIEINQ